MRALYGMQTYLNMYMNLPKYLSGNIEIIQKRCLKTIFSGYQYENILQVVNLQTLHHRRDE